MDKESGFTILETLVALVILGIGLAAFYQTFGTSTRAAATAERNRHATAAASNILAEIGRSRPLAIGVTTGKLQDGQRWTLDIRAVGNLQPANSLSSITSYVVEVTVGQDRDRGIAVRTLLLGPAL